MVVVVAARYDISHLKAQPHLSARGLVYHHHHHHHRTYHCLLTSLVTMPASQSPAATSTPKRKRKTQVESLAQAAKKVRKSKVNNMKGRGIWNSRPELLEELLRQCVVVARDGQQTDTQGFQNGHLNDVANKIFDKHGKRFDSKQLRNKLAGQKAL